MADKQLDTTTAASAFQKQWFADLRRRVFDERQPYALLQADVPFELFDLLEIPAVSNQWWASIIAAKRQAPQFLGAMDADGLHCGLCRYCSLGFASTRCCTSSRKARACARAHTLPRTHCVAMTFVICSVIRTGHSGAVAISPRTSSNTSSC